MSKKLIKEIMRDTIEYNFDTNTITCNICNKSFNKTYLEKHFISKQHQINNLLPTIQLLSCKCGDSFFKEDYSNHIKECYDYLEYKEHKINKFKLLDTIIKDHKND